MRSPPVSGLHDSTYRERTAGAWWVRSEDHSTITALAQPGSGGTRRSTGIFMIPLKAGPLCHRTQSFSPSYIAHYLACFMENLSSSSFRNVIRIFKIIFHVFFFFK